MNGTVIVTERPVGQHELGSAVAELLDHAEHVVPAAGVQPGRVLAQLVEDLLHLERGRGSSRSARSRGSVPRGMPSSSCAAVEDVVPEPRLEVALELRQVEVRARAAVERASARCGRRRGRSRTGSPSTARRRPGGASRAGASRAGGRAASRRSSFRR